MNETKKDIDLIIEKVKQEMSDVGVYQLKKKLPTDDDGIWWFYLPDVKPDIQIESSYGMCPFIVETNEQSSYDARKADTVDEAVSMIIDYLKPLRNI
jgi:hypothetical protein